MSVSRYQALIDLVIALGGVITSVIAARRIFAVRNSIDLETADCAYHSPQHSHTHLSQYCNTVDMLNSPRPANPYSPQPNSATLFPARRRSPTTTCIPALMHLWRFLLRRWRCRSPAGSGAAPCLGIVGFRTLE